MFDFFAEIHFSQEKPKLKSDIFSDINVYSNLSYTTHNADLNHSKFVWLTKKTDQESFFQDDRYLTLIYGYIFTRLDSESEIDKKRLNAKELTHRFQKYQRELSYHVKGAFTLLIFDKESNQLNLFTDKFNVNSVYYSYNEDRLLISSSLIAFKHYSPDEFGKINIKSLLQYCLFDFDLVNECFIEKVKTIPSATYLIAAKGKFEVNKSWDIFKAFAESTPIYNDAEGIEKVENLLKRNLDLYLDNPDKTAFALTGGYDSRTNLALLKGKADHCFFYSYGLANSFDNRIPKKISKKLQLNFKSFPTDKNFEKSFDNDAEIAVSLGDGYVEMSRGNYVYVYKSFINQYDQILTGLFGSELIKQPTSLGGYIDRNVRDLLLSDNLAQTFEKIIARVKSENFINKEILDEYKDSIFQDLVKNPFINNQFSGARKFFFYITGVGICRYFMKEIKTERPFVENLHPFLDIEFIELLLKTKFPWIYNWGAKKSLMQNLKIHKFYGSLIHRNNKKLSNIISTHAYRPKLLLKKIYLPILVLEYLYYSRKMNKIGIFKNEHLFWAYYQKRKNKCDKFASVFNQHQIENEYLKHLKDFAKLSSLQIWLHDNNLNF